MPWLTLIATPLDPSWLTLPEMVQVLVPALLIALKLLTLPGISAAEPASPASPRRDSVFEPSPPSTLPVNPAPLNISTMSLPPPVSMLPMNREPPRSTTMSPPSPRVRLPSTTPVVPFVNLTTTAPPFPMIGLVPEAPARITPLLTTVLMSPLSRRASNQMAGVPSVSVSMRPP